jgi:tetratricopeptide (TPR) repeat protein
MQAANEAYQAGDYRAAIEQYQALLDQGYYSAALYHNLGNAWYQIDRPGMAVLNYQRGLDLAPSDRGFRQNMELIREGFAEPIVPIPEFFLLSWWKSAQRLLGSNGWAVVGLLIVWGGFAGLARWRTAPQRPQRKKAFLVGVVLLVSSVLPIALAFTAFQSDTSRTMGVVVEGKPSLYQAADERSNARRQLEPGVTLEIRDQIGEWVKVRLVNGEIGWVKTTDFEHV